ncbi:MAG: hypothetical protein QG674_143 [Patescibacteria group bacterium]|jgi:mannose/fructose/N-acetylgalactosamine-specific phosphotransferase system component IIB|nr:hypothetical protein [Patescibacteria group bacterium]
MKRQYFEITVELKDGDFTFLITCEKEKLTKTTVWWIVYDNKSTNIGKTITYQQKEVSIFEYIKSQKPKFKTKEITHHDENYSFYLSSLLKKPLNLKDKVLPSALP